MVRTTQIQQERQAKIHSPPECDKSNPSKFKKYGSPLQEDISDHLKKLLADTASPAAHNRINTVATGMMYEGRSAPAK